MPASAQVTALERAAHLPTCALVVGALLFALTPDLKRRSYKIIMPLVNVCPAWQQILNGPLFAPPDHKI